MDSRSNAYLALKHSSLKEQAFQSRSQFSDDYKTPLQSHARPRTRSITDKYSDSSRHPTQPPTYHDTRLADSRYSDGVRASTSSSDINKSNTSDHRSSDFRHSSEYRTAGGGTAGGTGDAALRVPIPGSYRPRPRSIATDIGYSKLYSEHVLGPLSPEYEPGHRNSYLGSAQAGLRSDTGEVRKWGSCSRLEYNSQQPSTYGQFSTSGHERTDGDGGPSSYSDNVPYNAYRRHSSSKLSSHSGASSDDVIMAQKAEIDEKTRVIESLKMRMSESERAYSDKSGDHCAVAESLDSGIDIRSESGMKPLFPAQRPPDPAFPARSDDRGELARLRLHVKQLEARLDGGLPEDDSDTQNKLEIVLKENQALLEEKTSINRKFTRLQDYLTTLPTVNEFNELKDKLAHLAEDNRSLQEEQKRETSKEAKQRELELKKYQKKCGEMRENVQKLEKQNALLKSQNVNYAKQDLQKVEQEKVKMEKKMEQLKKEITVLSEQKESTKSLVGGYYEKYNNEQEKAKILSDSLDRSAIELGEMKLELEEKTTLVETLQSTLADRECELGEVQAQLQQFTDQTNTRAADSEVLMGELNSAFRDIQSVVEVCQMRVTGQQLDVSLLLGLGNSPVSHTDLTVEEQLKHIQAVRTDIEYLRNQLSELYAEEVGNKCPTQ